MAPKSPASTVNREFGWHRVTGARGEIRARRLPGPDLLYFDRVVETKQSLATCAGSGTSGGPPLECQCIVREPTLPRVFRAGSAKKLRALTSVREGRGVNLCS